MRSEEWRCATKNKNPTLRMWGIRPSFAHGHQKKVNTFFRNKTVQQVFPSEQYCTLYFSVPVVLYTVFMVFSLPQNLVKTLAKNLVKNLAKNLVKNLAKNLVKNLVKMSKKSKKVALSKSRYCFSLCLLIFHVFYCFSLFFPEIQGLVSLKRTCKRDISKICLRHVQYNSRFFPAKRRKRKRQTPKTPF